jgi:hypothetical protein
MRRRRWVVDGYFCLDGEAGNRSAKKQVGPRVLHQLEIHKCQKKIIETRVKRLSAHKE